MREIKFRAMKYFKKILLWFTGKHKCSFTKRVINDAGTKILNVCQICGAQDGKKFWDELNKEFYKKYPNLIE